MTLPASEETVPATDADIAAAEAMLNAISPDDLDEVQTDVAVMLRALIARIRSEREQAIRECAEWKRIETVPDNKDGPFLVTNNPLARNAFGRPSHVWCVQSIHVDNEGSFCAFDGFQKIHDLKLFMPVPTPPLIDRSAKT